MPKKSARLALLLLLWLQLGHSVPTANAQSMGGGHGQAPLSITVLLDLSYSMRLPISLNKNDHYGETRLDEAKTLLRVLIDGSKPTTEWALLTFGDAVKGGRATRAHVRRAFTTNGKLMEREIASLTTWGVSPVRNAIVEAERYSQRNASGRRRRLLLIVSDGIDTSSPLFEMPSPASLQHFDTPMVFAGIALRDAPALTEALEAWTRRAGGRYVDAANIPAVEEALNTAARSAVTISAPSRPPIATTPIVTVRASSLAARRVVRPRLLFLLIVVPLPLIVLFVLKRRYSLRRRRVEGLRRRQLLVRFAVECGNEHREIDVETLPVLINGGNAWPAADSVATSRRVNDETSRARPHRGPIVDVVQDRTVLFSRKPVLINGVAVRNKELQKGDRIRTRRSIWTYRETVEHISGPPLPTRPPFFPYLLSSLILAAAFFVFFNLLILSPRPRLPKPLPASVGTMAAAEDSAGAGHVTNVTLLGNATKVSPYLHTFMVPPGAKPDFFKADLMFIHTHPDDESIDFGGLMALESRSGKRIVSVVFTDGTAGLDQYPHRTVGGIYPAHSLRGEQLARVRVENTETALSILGSREYVRLGLRNSPYDSIREVLPLGEVLRRWGGEAQVVQRLVRLIEGFRPTIVVSPDEHHPGVFKHFEHEAVGYVTDRALAYLHLHGRNFVRAHLIGIDPMLTSQYQHVFGVNVLAIDPASGLSYRAIQIGALENHVTQRDASVIGVEVVPNFADEYYVARFWNLPAPPTEYFAPPGISGKHG